MKDDHRFMTAVAKSFFDTLRMSGRWCCGWRERAEQIKRVVSGLIVAWGSVFAENAQPGDAKKRFHPGSIW